MKLLKILFVFILAMGLVGCSDNSKELDSQQSKKSIVSVKIQETGIHADYVVNYDGYGSLGLYKTDSCARKTALIDKNGVFYFPYTESDLDYKYDDGVVSLAPAEYNELIYANEKDASEGISVIPKYFVNKKEIEIDNLISGGQVNEGYFYVYVGEDISNAKLQIYNKKGKKVAELDEDFSPKMNDEGSYLSINDNWGRMYVQNYLDIPQFNNDPVYLKYDKDRMDKDVNVLESGFVDLDTGKVKKFESDVGYAASGYVNGLVAIGRKSGDYFFFGLMDKSGNIVTPIEYSSFTFYDEYLVVRKNHDNESMLFGIMDYDGNFIIPLAEYSNIWWCSDDLICAEKDDEYWGVVNTKNEIVIPFQYDSIYSCKEGAIVVAYQHNYSWKCGVLNANNETLVPFEYDYISECVNGVMYAIKDGYLSIIKCEYEN